MKVAEGNEKYATPEVMGKIKTLAEKIEQMKTLRDEILRLAEDDDLWHLNLEWEDLAQLDVMDKHERWLASNHNC